MKAAAFMAHILLCSLNPPLSIVHRCTNGGYSFSAAAYGADAAAACYSASRRCFVSVQCIGRTSSYSLCVLVAIIKYIKNINKYTI